MSRELREKRITLLCLCAITIAAGVMACSKCHETYPMSGQVVAVNEEADTVTVESRNGNLWEFCGTEDWAVGDYCACLMDNNGTKEIYDDRILCAIYEGRD